MSKVIISPIEKWQGSVTIADPLSLPQAQVIEAGMSKPEAEEDGRIWLTVIDAQMEPAVFACVEKWELTNFTLLSNGHPPASPRKEAHALISWIFLELTTIYFGEIIIPNASSPTLTATQAKDSTPPKSIRSKK